MKISIPYKSETLCYAAEELVKYITAMTSQNVEIAEESGDIVLGLLPSGSVKDPLIDDKFVINIQNGKGEILGSNERSVLLGIYRYLKELGCRFVRPGKDGEVVPKRQLDGSVKVEETAFYPFRVECLEGAINDELVIDTIRWLPKVGYNAFFIQFVNPFVFYLRLYPGFYEKAGENRDEAVKAMFEKTTKMTQNIEREIKRVGLQFHDVGHGYTFEPFGIHYLDAVATRDIPEDKKELVKPYLPYRNGERKVLNGCINWTNMCLSNKELQKMTADWFVKFLKEKPSVDILHIWLGDGANNHCECEECLKLSVSDMYIDFLNEVDAALTAANINTKIVCIQYVNTRYAPRVKKFNNPNRFILMPAISSDKATGYTTEECKILLPPEDERNNFNPVGGFSAEMKLFKEWREQYPSLPIMFFDYHLYSTHFSDPSYMTVSKVISHDVKMLKEFGANGLVNCKTQRSQFPTSLPVYASGALLCNPERTYEEVTDEYFDAAYGKQAKVVKEYLLKLGELFDQKIIMRTISVVDFEAKNTGKTKPAWRDNEDAAKLFAQVEPTVNEFAKNLNEYIESAEDNCRRKSLELLSYHAEMAKLYGKALLAGATGNDEECQKYKDELLQYTAKNEEHFFQEFDVYLFKIAINNIFK